MKFFTGLIAVTALVAGVAGQAAKLTMNTPAGVTQCLASVLTWTGGTGPYIITVNPGGQPAAAPLETIDPNNAGTQVSWKCNIAAGQSVFFRARDAQGNTSETAPVTILANSDASCLTTTGTPAPTSGGGGATTAPPADTTAATQQSTPNPVSTPSNTGANTGTGTGTGTTGTPKPTGAATSLTFNAGVAGVVALGAALLA